MFSHRVLVTGGTGFIGSWLVRELIQNGYEVTVLDCNPTGELLEPVKGRYEFVQGDVLDSDGIRNCLKDVDAVCHLGAMVGRLISKERPYDSVRVNVEGTMNVLEACRANDVERLIFASTSEVLGEAIYTPMDEEHPLNPVTPYGIAKLAAEKFCLLYHRWYGMETICPRFFNAYGVGERPSEYRGVVTQFVWKVLHDQPPIVDRGCKRTFAYVTDIARGCRLLLEKGRAGEVYHLSGKGATRIEDLADLVIRLCGKEGEVKPVFRDPTPMDVRVKVPSYEKARVELGYEPETSLEEGLMKTIEWQKSLL